MAMRRDMKRAKALTSIPKKELFWAAAGRFMIRRHALERWVERAAENVCHWRVLTKDIGMSRPIPGLPGYRTLYGAILCMKGDTVWTVLPGDSLDRLRRHAMERSASMPVPKPAA